MHFTNNPIIKHKAGQLNLAEEIFNISEAYKNIGVSRDTLVVWKLDRLGRDLHHLINTVHDLTGRGVEL